MLIIRTVSTLLGVIAAVACVQAPAQAGVGTAVPPTPGIGAVPTLSAPAPNLPPLQFSAPPTETKGFTVIGFIESATVSDDNCKGLPKSRWGGTVTVNEQVITIPCNLIVQFPGTSLPWADLFDPQKFATTAKPAPAIDLTGSTSTPFSYPSTEIRLVGNIVGGRHIAAIAYVSQQSVNTGTGYIVKLDYDAGVIYVAGRPDGPPEARLQLNDPDGRFSKGQSPDTRFRVDDGNPTVRAVTGYPMCIPRTDPTQSSDPRCPQRNRPLAAQRCRNFADANWTLPSGLDLPAPVAGQIYCPAFVMKDPRLILDGEPVSTEQAPFEIGDFVTYSGTVLQGDRQGPGSSDTISVHHLVASVGIYTQPWSTPSYVAIDAIRIAAEAQLTFFTIPQEAPDRLVVDAFTTDVASIVDVYLVDRDLADGHETNRWVTPRSMTGGFGSSGPNGIFADGGITTQFTGPVPGRVRLRANKATPLLLASPTRKMRAVARSLCDPTNINDLAPQFTLDLSAPDVMVPCLSRSVVANGLKSGQAIAPVTDFIFPENIVPGDPVVPLNLWQMNFLASGEGPDVGPLTPQPW